METSAQLAHHLKTVFFGGNWTSVNVKDVLYRIDYKVATSTLNGIHSIATLVYHIGYYVTAIRGVLERNELNAKDELSFDCPLIDSEKSWEDLKNSTLLQVEKLSILMAQFPSHRLSEDFIDSKYGSYYRNFLGLIEHTHYHLGQIVLIKKLVQQVGEE
ncbi:hypothetical protein GCM10009117_02940 [Gangjinia marincola]|uniref:DUF1572 domain-containing protein n=1 Tax=Gangjinia marincola TaxID=578463 RepID=A0ABN1MDP8_9FLAO